MLTSLVLFIALGGSQKIGIDTDIYFFNVSVYNAFVLESEHVGSKRESVYFKLDLAQQLIHGFLQRKQKRRSNEVPPNHDVPQDQHVSVRIEGRK